MHSSLLIRENKLECLVAIKHFHPSRAILAKRGQSLPKCCSMWCHAWTKYCKYLWEKRSRLFSVIADDEEEKKFYNIENRKPSIKCWICRNNLNIQLIFFCTISNFILRVLGIRVLTPSKVLCYTRKLIKLTSKNIIILAQGSYTLSKCH